jgi:hypothetical protein
MTKVKKEPLCVTHPHLTEEWDVKKNNDLGLSTDQVTHGSNKRAFWVCKVKECGHEWSSTICNRTKKVKPRGCRKCAGMTVTDKNRLSTLRPEVVLQWDYKRNFPETPNQFSINSNLVKNWICSNCYNKWEESIINRTRVNCSRCPKCNCKIVTKENCLATVSPDLSVEWDYKKNEGLTPQDVFGSSDNVKYWWICEYGHSFLKSCNARQNGRGCPECVKYKFSSFGEQAIYLYVRKVFNDAISRKRMKFEQEFFEYDIFIPLINVGIEYDGEYFHRNKQESDERKNAISTTNGVNLLRIRESGLSDIAGSTNILGVGSYHKSLEVAIRELFNLLYTLCQNKGFDELCAKIATVVIDIKKDRSEIQNRLINYGEFNGIVITHPELASQWNYNKNLDQKPNHVTHGSNKTVWWICEKGHEWDAKISDRTNRENGCPFCSGRSLLYENSLEVVCPELASEWHPTKNRNLTPADVSKSSSQKVYWLVKGKERHNTVNSRYNKWKNKQKLKEQNGDK